ncbi:ribosome-inactivating family protein [Streptomyces sp. NPDC002888]|uniref:ribosome-inactivating family protein n=1 Tax=Streptomyces sp. NPDC002888 TaxID=3364668 RepID=UPI0036BD879C
MRTFKKLGRALRQAVLALTLALSVGAGVLSPAQPAAATTGNGQVNHVWLDLGSSPGSNLRIAYSSFLASLRAAVGFSAQGVEVTQNASENEGVVRVSLSADDDSGRRRAVDLWINPDNLYVIGFSPQANAGVSYFFNDVHINAAIPTARQILPFGGNYNSIVARAGRNRSEMPVAFWSVRQAILDLANQTAANSHPQTTARALMLLIQFTSEAARFNDLEGVFRDAMFSWDSSRTGIPEWLQHMENNWGMISNFFWNILGIGPNHNPAPLNISGREINDADDVRRYLRTVLPAVVGGPYNPGHDEL